MPRRGVINSALFNFLGTFTSRYSSFNGYWLFGFLAGEGVRLEFDLFDPPSADHGTAPAFAAALAAARFHDQMRKAGVAPTIEAANLIIETRPGKVRRPIDSHEYEGFIVAVSVRALAGGSWRHRESPIFVVPIGSWPWRSQGGDVQGIDAIWLPE